MKLTRLVLAIIAVISFLFLGFSNKEEEKSESNRIAVVVNKWLKPEIDANLNIYLNDLKNEGYEMVLREWDLENEPSPAALRGWLKGLYEDKEGRSLQGAVFIGDLPIPYVKVHPVVKEKGTNIHIADNYIAEMYYMDLGENVWKQGSDRKIEDPYTSTWREIAWDIAKYLMEKLPLQSYSVPVIWTSRIATSTLTGLLKDSESELVNSYLAKNHAYRTGQVVFPKQALLYSLPAWLLELEVAKSTFTEKEFSEARDILSQKYKLREETPEHIDEFLRPLENEAYQIIYWGRHGAKNGIDLGSQMLRSTSLKEIPINVLIAFAFSSSCWIGHYVEPGYFGGTFTFNKRFFVLGMPTATLPTYGILEVEMMNKFTTGSNLGIAFREAIKASISQLRILIGYYTNFSYLESIIASRNSRFILGDGTLKLQSDELVADESNSPERYFDRVREGAANERGSTESIKL